MADEPTPASPSSETPPPRTTGGNWRWEPPTAEELQKLMPGYTIEKILGRGGMGAVYRGVQTNLDRPVAIKILPPGVEKEDPSFAERFKSEARLMAKLSHPAVVGVYDFGTNLGGQLYFAMEYVDGSDVSQMIAAQGKLPPEHALAITAHVCDALQAAHELGIVHRDIKPANVLLNMKGQVKVADFGLAKVEDPGQHGLTKTGYAMGTPDFVAPEALMLGTAIDGRADLYAVGVMLYQMLTGNIPRGAFKPASVLVPGLDPRFDPIILKAMQHDREERHQNAAELRRELDVILTVPFVRNDAPASAAIPLAQMAQAPGQRSAAQKPRPRSAGAPTRQPSVKAGEGTRAPETPPKSKTPLLIGLGAAAAIGIGAFVILSGGKKPDVARLSKVESAPSPAPKPPTLESRATAKPQPKPATTPVSSSSPPPPVPKSSDPKFPPGQWVKVLTTAAELPQASSKAEMQDGWITTPGGTGLLLPADLSKNYGVRARFRGAEGEANSIVLRRLDDDHSYQFKWAPKAAFIQVRDHQNFVMLARKDFKDPRPDTDEQVWECSVIGSKLIGRYGSDGFLFANNDEVTSGRPFIAGPNPVCDIEVINLDGLSEAEALKILGVDEKGNDLRKPAAVAATAPAPAVSKSPPLPVSQSSDKFPPGQWVKVFTKFEDLPEGPRKKHMKFQDGWLINESNDRNPMYLPDELGNNCAIRMRILRGPDKTAYRSIALRSGGRAMYVLQLGDKTFPCTHMVNGATETSISNLSVPVPEIGSEYTLEFAVLGNRLLGRYNTKLLVNAVNDSLTTGTAYISGIEPIRDIEVINLDGLSEAEALKILGVDEKGNDLRKPAAVAATAPAPAVSKSPPLPVSPSSDKFPPGQWVKLFTKAEDLPEDLRKPDSGVKFEDGWLRFARVREFPLAENLTGNYGVRVRALHGNIAASTTVVLRRQLAKEGVASGHYSLKIINNQLYSQRREGNEFPPIFPQVRLPEAPLQGQEYTLEFAVVGERLIARHGAAFFKVVKDTRWKEGTIRLASDEAIRDIEVINLDGLPEAEALKILGVDEKGNDLRAAAVAAEKQAMEQAKVVDAASAIPELKTLHEQFVKLQAERVTAPFAAEVAKLNAGYVGGIDREIANEKKAGHLDGVIALEAEKKLIASKQPIPAEDDEKTTEALKKLRGIYLTAYAKLEAARAENLKALTDPLSLRLKQLEATLTQQDRIDHAKTVREYREGLGRAAGPPAAASVPADANVPSTALGGPSALPKKKFPPGDDRKAAEWVLSVGGSVEIAGNSNRIADTTDLPRGRFEVTEVYLEFSSTKRPLAPVNDLLPLAGLKNLARLHLKELPLEEAHLEIVQSLPSLATLWTEKTGIGNGVFAHLASSPLTTLQLKIEPQITGEGISALSSCKELINLALFGCQPTQEGLRQIGSLEQLTKLTLSNCSSRVQDDHLPLLGRLKKLTSLNLRRTNVTAEGLAAMKVWSGLTDLGFDPTPGKTAQQVDVLAAAFPKLDGLLIEGDPSWTYSIDDLRALKGFPRLRKFSCTTSLFADAILPGLLEVDGLEELVFTYNKMLTDASLDTLAKLRKLKRLEIIGCPQITDAAIAAFKKERPDVTVTR